MRLPIVPKTSNGRRALITLCGSTRFKEDFMRANEALSLAGIIVLMPGVFAHADNLELTDNQKMQLDELHKTKIAISDAILIINKDGYMGESTKREIDFAKKHHIPVLYMEDPNQ